MANSLLSEIKLESMSLQKKISLYLFAVCVGGTTFGLGEFVFLEGHLSLRATFVCMVVALICVIVLHEGLHGLFFRLFGGRPKFGFKAKTKMGPAFYVTAPGSHFTKRQFIVIVIAPQILTVVSFLVLGFAHLSYVIELGLLLLSVFNLTGGALDAYMFLVLVRQPRDILAEDTITGIKLWASKS